LSVRDLVSIALFTAFIAALALVPAIPVPVMISSIKAYFIFALHIRK